LPKGVSEKDLAAFAARTGVELPLDFRSWLKVTNGPCIGPGGVYGVRPARDDFDIEQLFAIHPEWKQRGWVPIAGDGSGNHYVIFPHGDLRPVGFVDAADDSESVTYVVASDALVFLSFLLRRELGERGWPFEPSFVFDRVQIRPGPSSIEFPRQAASGSLGRDDAVFC